MGIPGFYRRTKVLIDLETIGEAQEGVQTPSVQNAVIDGNSLVFYATQTCIINAQGVRTYKALYDEVVRRLQQLEEFGFKITDIIFDGALPEYKIPERMDRQRQTATMLHRFRARNSRGDGMYDLIRGYSVPFAASMFFIPAIYEELIKGPYASLTYMVPGEADEYAALAASRLSSAAIFTNDSDLALYSAGPHVEIVMIRTMREVSNQFYPQFKRLRAEVYHPERLFRGLCRRDVLRVGFLMHIYPEMTFRNAFSKVIYSDDWPVAEPAEEEEFQEFAERYAMPASLPSRRWRTIFDSRISEIVYQIYDGSQSLHAFLPIPAEDPTRRTAWNVAIDLRQTAYSILGLYDTTRQDRAVYEYFREGMECVPKRLSLLDPVSLDYKLRSLGDKMNALLTNTEGYLRTATLKWRYVGVALLIDLFCNERLILPTSSETMYLLMRNAEPKDWYRVHLQAQLQAALYSLRMLKQTCQAVDHLGVWPPLTDPEEEPLQAGIFDSRKEPSIDAKLRHSIRKLKDILRHLPSLTYLMGLQLFTPDDSDYVDCRYVLEDFYSQLRLPSPGSGEEEHSSDGMDLDEDSNSDGDYRYGHRRSYDSQSPYDSDSQ